jgi:putative endonuclease
MWHLFDRLRHARRRSLWTADQATGRHGEDLAHRYLRRQGYVIVARNYRLAAGDAEADLIARDGDMLVIVEVKTRADESHGPPERAISTEKVRALTRVAREYARKSGLSEAQVRCDVVSILLGKPPRIELLKDAVKLRL